MNPYIKRVYGDTSTFSQVGDRVQAAVYEGYCYGSHGTLTLTAQEFPFSGLPSALGGHPRSGDESGWQHERVAGGRGGQCAKSNRISRLTLAEKSPWECRAWVRGLGVYSPVIGNAKWRSGTEPTIWQSVTISTAGPIWWRFSSDCCFCLLCFLPPVANPLL